MKVLSIWFSISEKFIQSFVVASMIKYRFCVKQAVEIALAQINSGDLEKMRIVRAASTRGVKLIPIRLAFGIDVARLAWTLSRSTFVEIRKICSSEEESRVELHFFNNDLTMTKVALDIKQTGEEAVIFEMEIVYKFDSQAPVKRSSPSRL
ncbi:hypothetical protein Tco_0343989 [Tanacetum coccineum]